MVFSHHNAHCLARNERDCDDGLAMLVLACSQKRSNHHEEINNQFDNMQAGYSIKI